MLKEITTVLTEGDSSGNDMLLRFDFPSGLQIFGLPTRNHYGGYWDLGPTWNYLVLADTPFLVDTGRYYQTDDILAMMKKVGFNPQDLGFILLSHGHEDHDGGVAALAEQCGAAIKAHPIYETIVRLDPEACPPDVNPEFPVKCWNCFMPWEHIEKNCLGYHKAISTMKVDSVREDPCQLMPGVTTHYTPGHSPDSLCTLVNDEAILVGDTILPEITPWPSTLIQYIRMSGPLKDYAPEEIFGLRAFVKSMHRLRKIAKANGPLAVLPAHRLYYRDVWNDLDLTRRIDQVLHHHIKRCGASLEALEQGPATPKEIALKVFPERLLKGLGKRMAKYEILSHLELMEAVGDVAREGQEKFAATGSTNFEGFIKDLSGEEGSL